MITKINKLIVSFSVPVTNNTKILNHMVNNIQINSFKNKNKCLSTTLITELTDKFGKYNKGLRLEFLTKVWILEYKGLVFNVFSANNKGTSIEICGYSYEEIRTGTKEKEIIEFLDELYKIINS